MFEKMTHPIYKNSKKNARGVCTEDEATRFIIYDQPARNNYATFERYFIACPLWNLNVILLSPRESDTS